MIRQDMFDLCWGNVLASSDDGVIRTSLHEEVTIIIEVSGVPRRIPALTDDRRVLTEVLARHLLATNEDFTYRSRRHELLSGPLISISIPGTTFPTDRR